MEDEYRALSSAYSEIKWLRGLLCKLGTPFASANPLYGDNTSDLVLLLFLFSMKKPRAVRFIVISFETINLPEKFHFSYMPSQE